MQDLISL